MASLSETNKELQVTEQRLQDINKEIKELKSLAKSLDVGKWQAERDISSPFNDTKMLANIISKYTRVIEGANKKIRELEELAQALDSKVNKSSNDTMKLNNDTKNTGINGLKSEELVVLGDDDGPIINKYSYEELEKEYNKLKSLVDEMDNLDSKVTKVSNDSDLKDTNKELDNISNKTKSATDEMTNLDSKVNKVSNDIEKINNSKLDNLDNKTTSEANGLDKLDSKVADAKIDTVDTRLEQVKNILDGSVSSITRYTNAFNKMSSIITDEVNGLDTSIEELKDKLNGLYADANKLGNIGKSLKTNDAEQINKYAESVNKLDSEITELLPDIESGFEAVNSVIASKFKGIDGNTGKLKADLNSLVSEFSAGIIDMNANKLDVPVSLKNFSESIKEQVDKIEYEMGRLTMFTNTRDMEELSLGFKINQNDIDDAVKKQKEKIGAIKEFAQGVEYKHGEYYDVADDKLTPQFFKDFKDKAEEIANINNYIKQINGNIGKNVKGYLDLFNEASTLLQSSKPFMNLLEASTTTVSRASYPNISNWKNATVDDILNANKQGSFDLDALLVPSTKSNSTKSNSDSDNFDKAVTSAVAKTTKQTLQSNEIKSREAFINDKNAKLESIKNEEAAKTVMLSLDSVFGTPKNVTKDASEETKKSSEEVKKSSEEVKKSLESIKKELNESNNAYDKSASSVKNYASELNNLLEKDKSLSDEAKESILSKDNSSAINRYTSNLNNIQKDLNKYGNIQLTDAPALKLGNNANGVKGLNNYKISITQAKADLEGLIKEQEEQFKLISDPSKIIGKNSVNINASRLNNVRSTLESGYKVNLVDGSAAKNEFDELETKFKQFINNYKTFKLNILDTKQIDNLIKLDNITKEIQSVNAEAVKHEKALADYENNKIKYAEKYKAIAQAESNIRAIERVKQSKISGSKHSVERETLASVYDEVSNKQHNRISSLRREIEILENDFRKHGLEIPVVPKIARPLPSDSNFGELLPSSLQKDYMSLIKDNRNEFKSLLYNTDLDSLNKQASDLGINTDKINNRLSAIKNTITGLFNAGQTDKARELVEVYNGEIDKLKDKVNGVSKAQQISVDRQKQAIKSLLEETRNYASTQEALNNKPMSYADQAAYYDKQLSKFEQGTREYIEVLKLKNQAENKAADESVRNAEEASRKQQEAIKSLLDETKNYVSTQEALNNEPMSYSDQAAYYNQQLSKFEEGTREYIEVLKLKNQAENKAAEETKKAAEAEEKAHLEALEAAKQRVTGILSTIKSFADGINSAVNRIVQIIRTGISIINKVISGATKFVVTIGHGIRSIITLFGNLGNRVKSSLLDASDGSDKVNNSFNILKGSATELRSKILLLKGAFDGLFNGELVKKAENLMASVYSLQNIAGSNTTQEVLDWANSMEYAFGLSAKDLICDINELTGVLYGLGMSAKNTALGSENILMISRYLAFMGAAGGDTATVMNKLVSGMKGMTQAIDDLGLSVRDAQMDAFLKSLKAQGGEFAGIATDFSSLNEQARVYVRYASIIDQFTRNYDITNFADALTTVTGRMQILRQSVNSLVTTLGTGLTKVLANLATYLIPVIKLIEQLVTKIFKFFGIDVTMTTNINEGTAALSGLGDGLDDTKDKLDEVSDSAKKAGGNLQSFDRINNVTSSKSKSGKGGDDDFDYSKLMSSMLDNLNALASKATVSYSDKLLENFKKKLAEMKQALIDFEKDITGRDNFDLKFDWSRIKNNLKTIRDNIIETIKSWGSFVIEIALKIADDVNIGLIITRLTDLLAKVSEVAKVITDVLIPAFRAFYDIALSPIVKYIGREAVSAIHFMIRELDKWKKWFTDNKDTILQFFTDLAEITNAAWKVLKPLLNESWNKLGNSISKSGENLRKDLDELMSNTNENKPATIERIQKELPVIYGEFEQILISIKDIVKALVSIIKDLAGAFGEFAKNELLPWLNEKLGELSAWLNENKDKIVDFITKIASATWEGFKIFVDLLGKLIDYVVQNPDSVFKFFEALIGLKVASWFTSTAASIGMALIGLKGLTGFVSGAGSTLSGLFGGGAAGGAGGAAGEALEAIGAAAGPIALVVAAVVALIAAVKDLWDTSESFRQAIKDIWDNIVEAFDNAKEKISTAFDNIKEAWDNFYQAYENSGLKSIIEALVTLIAKYLGGAISSTIDLIGNMFSTTANLLADIINIVAGVIDIFGGLADIIIGAFTLDWDKIKQGWDEIVNGLLEIVQGLLHGIIDIIGGVVGQFIDNGSRLVGGLGQGISDAWQGLIESVRGLIDDFIKAVKDFFGIHSPSKVFAEIGDFLVQGLLQGIQNAWNAFSEAVIGLFEGLIEGIESTFSGIGEFFSKTFTNAKELALNAWSNAYNKFTEVKNRVASAFDGLKENVRTTFTTAKENAVSVWNDAKSRFTTVADNIASGLASIKYKAREIFVDVRNSASSILSDIGTQLSNAWNEITTTVSTGWSYVTGNTRATTGRKITSHAVGGSIAGGQLFIANENGNAELIGNIDGSGKTNVANNNMIMQAMESGIFEAVYNAMAEVMNQRGTVGNSGNTTIKIDGFGLIDASTLRELARILAPYLRSNDINIADTKFSI